MSKLSERLQEYMSERNLTQSALAKLTGIERSNISEYLSQKHCPSYANLVTLLSFFDCSADYLLGLKDIPTEQPFHPVGDFGKRLRMIMQERTVSQYRMVLDLPVSSSVLYKWLHGISFPNADNLIRIAEYLECSVDYLLGRTL